MDARQQRGMLIAATTPIARVENQWMVPSQSLSPVALRGRDGLRHSRTARAPTTNCGASPASTSMPWNSSRMRRPPTAPSPRRATARVTYAQNWPAYNAAQTAEKEEFCRLLHDLCAGVAEPAQVTGRPRLPLGDMIFAAASRSTRPSARAAS